MINYSLLGKAVDFYENAGFKRIEAPWLVTKAISDITKPLNASSYLVKKDTEDKTKVFVASGEQSLLYLINKGFVPSGDYQTVTPCMRNDEFDEIHTKYFMKLELMRVSTDTSLLYSDLKFVASTAYKFFLEQLDKKEEFKLKLTKLEIPTRDITYDITYDIEYDGIEIGSYGIRTCSFCNWVYGTGLAEPRYSRFTMKGF